VHSEYEAVVYDLDGTLVRLAVDWGAVAGAVVDVFEASGDDVSGMDLWAMMDRASGTDLEADVEAAVSEFEITGARESERLPTAAELPRPEPVGVCSLNCAEACHVALETHGLTEAVDAVVGRDSVTGQKPDPEPLLAAIEQLDAAPERTLFVGDSESDEETATAAGTDFRYVSGR
jgi:phosphoglycolate phosphatase